MNIALPSGAIIYTVFGIALFLALILAFYFYNSFRKKKKEIIKEREEASRRIYELAILKELGERVGYSLNVEEILQIITGSLKQFLDYTAVAYIVISQDRIKINTHLDKSVGKIFLSEMKTKMLASLSALTNQSFETVIMDEAVSGAIVIEEEQQQKVGSLFNIPLVINSKVAGVLTIAHLDKGLYKEEDMTILYKITNQASQAVSRLQEVVESEKGKLNAMVLSMADGVLMFDQDYRVMVANPAVKKIINFKGDKDVSIFDFIDALGGKFDIRGKLEEVAAKKEIITSERINLGESFFEISVCPVLHSSPRGEELFGVVTVFHDITRDIELERVREEFASMIVHELRSPLDGVKKMIELMISGAISPETDQFKEYLNLAYQSSGSMLELVNDILDFSKLQAGKFEVSKEDANPREVVENRVTFYKISAEAKKLSLSAAFSGNLPTLCQFDTQAVKQVLNNFISNSMKFTSQGGSILVSAFVLNRGEELPGDFDRGAYSSFPTVAEFKISMPSLCVVVSDTGIGIPEDQISELFHTYKQVKLGRAQDGSKGTGLGLVIAKGIAEAHGGTVGVASKEGMGSSFFFTIPL
jgi:signal transduction histidine kinase